MYLYLTDLCNKYRITAVLKVEKDININIAASLIGQAEILLIMYVDGFFFCLLVTIWCVWYKTDWYLVDTDNITLWNQREHILLSNENGTYCYNHLKKNKKLKWNIWYKCA